LKGKTLGCWCREVGNKKKRICHGDILLELIKEVESETKTVKTVESETKTVESETKEIKETKTNKLLKLINETKNNKLIRKIKKCSITENEKYVIIDTSALSNDELIKSFLENIISKTKENIKIKKKNLV
jgi:predicted dinucleotide-utilizing enzyme